MTVLYSISFIVLFALLIIFTYIKAYSKGYRNGGNMVLDEWKKFESREDQWEGVGD